MVTAVLSYEEGYQEDSNYADAPKGKVPIAMDGPKCPARNERWFACKPCESTCTDWVQKKTPSCKSKVCTPGCGCIPGWHRKNQKGQFSGTCVRPTWCDPLTVTKTVVKYVTQPTPPAYPPSNPCSTTVCAYGTTCESQNGRAVCTVPSQPATPTPTAYTLASSPSYSSANTAPSTPSYPSTGATFATVTYAPQQDTGSSKERSKIPVNQNLPGGSGCGPLPPIQQDAPRKGPLKCPKNEFLTQCGGCEDICSPGNSPKPVHICTKPKPCVRQCKCNAGFARINSVCTPQNLCQTTYRPKLTVKTVVITKTQPGTPPQVDPCSYVSCSAGTVCQAQGQQGVCVSSSGGGNYGSSTPAYSTGSPSNAPQSDAPRRTACYKRCAPSQRCELKNDDNSCYNPPCPSTETCVPY
ncbi:hypothetical protein RB195_015154 [Necator americanus]|uniref:Follistatin-like domain-containing protein n=1 Tax=Necator americanus TaxID=51031 RepID=A0ABR1E398_NECAM